MSTTNEQYATYVSLITQGYVPFEPLVRKFAQENNLALAPLESAMEKACARLIELYLEQIRGGRVHFAERAYQLARERNYPTAEIDSAVAEAAARPGAH